MPRRTKAKTITRTAYFTGQTFNNVGQFWIQTEAKTATQIKYNYKDGKLNILSMFRFQSPYFPFLKTGNEFRPARPGEIQEMKKSLDLYIQEMFTY